MSDHTNDIIILGAGLTGLSAGYVLTKAGYRVNVLESDSTVGGLSKTIVHNGFRFDLGGHRFFTKDEKLNDFVKNLMREELISVPRKSKIFMRGRYFDYPLKPVNAVFGLGITTTMKILFDYGAEKIRSLFKKHDPVSLEDWVVGNFGRTMFNLYFKVYSEKVWGIDCNRISAAWVDQRVSGLSLATAVRNALFKLKGKPLPTLVDQFFYPLLGIGRISDRLCEDIVSLGGGVSTQARVERIHHADSRVQSIVVNSNGRSREVFGADFISSIPVTKLVAMLDPAPPAAVLDAASKLTFRDLVVVAVMVNRKQVTDLTWLYIPEKHIPFGRIHEPTNWSEQMAPEGKTLVVMEYFSFKGDQIWTMDDKALSRLTVENLERLGFISQDEVIDSIVVRVPKAYPLFEVGHEGHLSTVAAYLSRFSNLHLAGRSGMFKYYNMDHALESGMETAERILNRPDSGVRDAEPVSAGEQPCAVR